MSEASQGDAPETRGSIDSETETTVVGGSPSAPPIGLLEIAAPSVFEPGAGRRYEVRELLGQGGTGQVYAAFDHDLDREVAVKVVHEPDLRMREMFMREARVTASLGHPSVPPLYDVGTTGDALYLSMPRVTGRSLGTMIRSACAESRAEVMPASSLLEVLLKLCDAISYAHARGIIHQDIKPDNIMIGEYGEVMLVDWGAASSATGPAEGRSHFVGTPAYIAPEQLRGVSPSVSSDVFAIGATLFHALLLRKPLVEPDYDRFWQRKLGGEIDAPTAAELSSVPRPLIGVALKAMSLDVRERYGSVAELAQALRDFQAGRNAWAAPSISETFADDGYLERWVGTEPDAFVREPGRLVSRCPRGALLIHKQRLTPGLAVEFDGEILPDGVPGDLSVVWTCDDVLEGGPHWPKPSSCWALQVGAYANLRVGIYQDLWRCVSGRSLSIDVGRRYKIRAEINIDKLRLLLDGEVVAEYEELFPVPSGYVALYTFCPGKAFYNLKLYERGMPERLSPTAIGDAYYADQDYRKAAQHYARIEQLLPFSSIAEEACYKRGRALLGSGDSAAAEQAWLGLRAAAWRARAELLRVDAAVKAGEHARAVSMLRELLRDAPALRGAIIDRWTEYVERACHSDARAVECYVPLRDAEFEGHEASASAAASALIALGQWRAVVERFPDQPIQFADACTLLGDFERIVERYPNAPFLHDMALVRLGRFAEAENTEFAGPIVKLLRGEAEATSELFVEARLYLGQYEKALLAEHIDREERGAALRGLGRDGEALALGDVRALAAADCGEEALGRELRLHERAYLSNHLALQAYFAGDIASFRRRRAAAEALPCGATWLDVWVHRFVFFPLIDELCGERGAFERSLRESMTLRRTHWFGKLFHCAGYALGETSEADFMAQPFKLYLASRFEFTRALRSELMGDRAATLAAYRSYLALPDLARAIDNVRRDPLVDRWARFRVAELSPAGRAVSAPLKLEL